MRKLLSAYVHFLNSKYKKQNLKSSYIKYHILSTCNSDERGKSLTHNTNTEKHTTPTEGKDGVGFLSSQLHVFQV